MSNFTKGPWEVLPEEGDKDYIRIRGTILGGRYKVANVVSLGYKDKIINDKELEESRGNANLISAAPDMYEALQMVIERCEEDDARGFFDRIELQILNDALDKADGKEIVEKI